MGKCELQLKSTGVQVCYLSPAKLSWEEPTGMGIQNLYINLY